MSLYLLVLTAICGQPNATADAKSTPVAAVLLESRGPVFLSRNSKRVVIQNGQGMYAGDVLLVPEDSEAVLVYRSGRQTRLQGPARTIITAAAATITSSTGNWRSRSFGLFKDDYAGELLTTVGGVRKPSPLALLSPYEKGFTPAKFRVAWSMFDRAGEFGPADKVLIRLIKNNKTLMTRSVELDVARRGSGQFEVELPRLSEASAEYSLELQLLAVDDFGEDVPVGECRKVRLYIASLQIEKELAAELQLLQKQFEEEDKAIESTSRTLLAIARAQTFLSHGFYGEAVAEISGRLAAEPDNVLWKKMLKQCLSDSSTARAATN